MENNQFEILDDECDKKRLLCYALYFLKKHHQYITINKDLENPHRPITLNKNLYTISQLLELGDINLYKKNLKQFIKNNYQYVNTGMLKDATNYVDELTYKYKKLDDPVVCLVLFSHVFYDLYNNKIHDERQPHPVEQFHQFIYAQLKNNFHKCQLIRLCVCIAMIELSITSVQITNVFNQLAPIPHVYSKPNQVLESQEIEFLKKFTFNFFAKYNIHIPDIQIIGLGQNLVDDSIILESLIWLHTPSQELFKIKYKKAVAQKKYRGNEKTKTLNVQISTQTKAKLDELLNYHDRTQARYIETLINDAYKKMEK